MKLTTEYIFEHLDEYCTDTYEIIVDSNGHTFKNSLWNHIHGGWDLGKSKLIKKDVYAIMPYFDNNGKISCNKVLKGFITEWYPSENKENLIFTSLDIIGPHNTYHGKSVRFSNLADSCYSEYIENFAMFDTKSEAQEALKILVASKQNDVLNRQILTIKNEIADLQNKLKMKQEKLDALMKKLNSI